MSKLDFIFLAFVIGHVPDTATEAQTPDQQYQALVREYDEAERAFLKANEEAETQDDYDTIPRLNARDYAGGFMALARSNPGTEAAEDALIWVCSHTFETRDCEDAKGLILRDHVQSPKLGPAIAFQGHYSDYFEGTEAFFRTILSENPHREIRGFACYWLARHLQHRVSGASFVETASEATLDEVSAIYAGIYGTDWSERLSRVDTDALEREAELLYERVLRDYADIPHNDKSRDPSPLGDLARDHLFERRVLGIGQPAPDFEGTDLDGRPFRLSDHRGKVVVLDFGSHFYCGLCHLTYPRLQDLSERLANQPFIVVSINAEPDKDDDEIKAAWEAEGNTWLCLNDKIEDEDRWIGPIQRTWNVRNFPTLYLLDQRGIIRFKDGLPSHEGHIHFTNPEPQELGDAVDSLLNERQNPPGSEPSATHDRHGMTPD